MKGLLFALFLVGGMAQALPTSLTVGYEDEGKIDASLGACSKIVSDITAWSGEAFDNGVVSVCTARKNHIDAYQQLQAAYTKFTQSSVGTDKRFDAAHAVSDITAIIRSCMHFRGDLTTGGHNITTDTIPNEAAAKCLRMGADLFNEQSLK